MGDCVQFLSQPNDFLDILFGALVNPAFSEILISGIWDGVTYRQIIDRIISSNHADKIKIIIPNVLGQGTLSRSMINKIVKNGGKVNVNNNFSNNLIVVGGSAFIVSYSCRQGSEYRQKHYFESCIFTNDDNTVNEIKKLFNDKWNKGFPLVMEEAMGDSV